MARAIEELGRLRVGYAELGMHGDRQGSVKQQVHDGGDPCDASLSGDNQAGL